jgi:mRNA interferase MazF
MRPIHLAALDKTRPVLILTREQVRPYRTSITVAPITSTVRGLSTEVPVGRANGLDHESVISCDNITTIPRSAIGRHLGYLQPAQEHTLAVAIAAALDLDL